jgi:hypothetical protein
MRVLNGIAVLIGRGACLVNRRAVGVVIVLKASKSDSSTFQLTRVSDNDGSTAARWTTTCPIDQLASAIITVGTIGCD